MMLTRKLLGSMVALSLVGCATSDSTAPGDNGGVQISIPANLASFSGLVVEQIHVVATKPTNLDQAPPVVYDHIFPFDVDRNTLNLALQILTGDKPDTLDVSIDFTTAGGRVLFTTRQQVVVIHGRATNANQFPAPTYLGPGNNVFRLTINPRTPVVTAGGTLDFTVAAVDTFGTAVDTVYLNWKAAAGRINALGHFTAPSSAGTVMVTAAAPNGHRDSTLVTVVASGTSAISGTVVNGQNGAGLQGVSVKVVATNGDTVASVVTGADGSYTTPPVAAGSYTLVASLNGYVSAVAFNTDATGGAATAPTIPLVPDFGTTGNITGGVSDATTGSLISNPTLEIRAGVNATTGTPLATTTGDVESVYFFNNLPHGTYTITAIAPGYVTGSVTTVALADLTTDAPGIILSPVGAGIARVVLTWGAAPSDLDAHLTGPDSTTGNRFHVFFGDQGRSDSLPHAALDIDNTDGFGPETITITKQFSGVYRFSVHDYTNSDLNPSSALAGSGARVQLFLNGALSKEFFVPNQPGTLWTVFELNGSTVTSINQMSYQPNSDDVTIRAPGSTGKIPKVRAP
jgi:hypothetical protein